MKIYDITQELFHGKVYPGDPVPRYERTSQIVRGDICNLTMLNMCTHNATHVDAPYHFYEKGKTVEELDLSRCIGPCQVVDLLDDSLDSLEELLKTCRKRLLFKGDMGITPAMAKLFNRYGIVLIGVEGQSVDAAGAPGSVHFELLSKEVVLLEGLSLAKVPAGEYFLSAAPLKLGGCDGAPCRAVLLQFEGNDADDV
jgi:arylformamidase